MLDCYTAAIRILKYRFNSEVELRRKLQAKRFEKDDIEATIARLRLEHWIDDERFAGAYVRTLANKRVGSQRIRRELHAAGVNGESATDAIAKNVDPEREREALSALCEKRMRMLERKHGVAYVKTSEGRAKLVAYLVTQGYDSGSVRAVIGDAAAVEVELQEGAVEQQGPPPVGETLAFAKTRRVKESKSRWRRR